MTDAEEEPEVVVGELDVGGVGGVQERLELGEGFAGDEDALFAADAFHGFIGLFYEGQAMAVGGDHGDGFSLEDQEGAVEGVAGLFVGYGEYRASDEGLEDHDRNLDVSYLGQLGNLGIVCATQAHHLGIRAAGANLDPVVIEKLDGDFSLWQELDVVVKLAGGDGARAGLFDLGIAASANGLVKIGGGDVELIVCCFHEEVGEDRDGGFALDNTLSGGEFFEQIVTGDGDFHD